MLFKLVIISEAQKKLKTQSLLLIGMCFSACAILISIFNMVMCAQNEFDPIVLETEMLRRFEKLSEKMKELERKVVAQQIKDFKQQMINECFDQGLILCMC